MMAMLWLDMGMQKPNELQELAWVRQALLSGKARRIREASRLTTGEAAAAIQVTAVTVWRWENGHRVPRRDAALRYGQLLRTLSDVPSMEAA